MASVIEFDVKSAVLSNGIFGKEQIDQIVTAIGEDFTQFSVLRDGVSELEVEEQHSPATSTRLGVCYYLLGRFNRALEELTTKLPMRASARELKPLPLVASGASAREGEAPAEPRNTAQTSARREPRPPEDLALTDH